MLIVLLTLIVITGTILGVSLCRMVAPATEAERLADDEAQINYLHEWSKARGRT
jgi:hypothetical protein